jgi:GNAT superfamily N-acetyltransferase
MTPDALALLRAFEPDDLQAAASLIGRAMNADEQCYAERVFGQYFAARQAGVDDGRDLYVLPWERSIAAITGLHQYSWGPPGNVWLSWFAVDPMLQGRDLGKLLLQKTVTLAGVRGFTRMFFETYSSPTFDRARRFYISQGFERVGHISGYMPDGADMIVFARGV